MLIKKYFLILPFLLIPLLSKAQDSQKIAPGLWLETHTAKDSQNTYELTVTKVDLNHFQIKPYYSKKPTLVFYMQAESDAILMMNANFFDPQKKPLGLVKIDKNILFPKKNISWWSIFCIKNNQAEIIHSSVYKDKDCDQAVQAGPRLITSGVIPKLKDETSRKSAIGIDRNGLVYFIVSAKPIPIKVLAQFLNTPTHKGGLGLIQALNMDGGSSTQMYFNWKHSILKSIPSMIPVPVGLGVYAK